MKIRVKDKSWFLVNYNPLERAGWHPAVWDCMGKVYNEDQFHINDEGDYILNDEDIMFLVAEVDVIEMDTSKTTYSDKHYDCWYELTPEDIEAGKIKIDPYRISEYIKLGEKDNSGCLFHIFKTIFRWGEKNPIEREVKAVEASLREYKKIKRIS